MRLVFYSGGYPHENEHLDLEVLRLIGKTNPSMTFIPSAFEGSTQYYEEFVESFKRFGVVDFFYFPIDIPFTEKLLIDALDSDFIFLSGGNTYYFLKHLRKTGILRLLRERARSDHFVLGGMSAGAIIMTSNIGTAGIPEFDKDENDVKIKNFNGMGLVPHEFFPHFINSKSYTDCLIEYSKSHDRLVIGSPDSSGVIYEEQKFTMVGRNWGFLNGHKFRLY